MSSLLIIKDTVRPEWAINNLEGQTAICQHHVCVTCRQQYISCIQHTFLFLLLEKRYDPECMSPVSILVLRTLNYILCHSVLNKAGFESQYKVSPDVTKYIMWAQYVLSVNVGLSAENGLIVYMSTYEACWCWNQTRLWRFLKCFVEVVV